MRKIKCNCILQNAMGGEKMGDNEIIELFFLFSSGSYIKAILVFCGDVMVEISRGVYLATFFTYEAIETKVHLKFVQNNVLCNGGGWTTSRQVDVKFLSTIQNRAVRKSRVNGWRDACIS